jgi:CTP:molybdopterin cytidylyltransferase MocA
VNSSIVLAAGMSTRMGAPKALLPWDGQPLLSYQVQQLREAGLDEVIVVLGDDADEIHRAIRRADCRVMLNPRFQMGRAGSLRIGAKAVNRDAEAIIIVNVDQPRPASFVRTLLDGHHRPALITRPAVEGRHGHPIVVAGELRGELMEARDEERGLEAIVHRHSDRIAEVATDDLGLLDINTPDAYHEARRRFGLES